MTSPGLDTPVAFFIFNRPETTTRVFERIAAVRPRTLLVVADGPRPAREGEARLCGEARSVLERVDWDCDLRTSLSDVNLGCRARMSSGVDWVFSQVPEAILLEDDCLPHPDFFPFCEQLLARYRDDERVGMIGGTNFQFGQRVGSGSWYFSKYAAIWGWASWRRAWRNYDVDCRYWPAFRASGAFDRIMEPEERWYWIAVLDRMHRGEIDTWDYQWLLSCWVHSMLVAVPQSNLISNIGFGAGATHTVRHSPYADMPTVGLEWPLVEPPLIIADRQADRRTAAGQYNQSWTRRLKARLRAWSREH